MPYKPEIKYYKIEQDIIDSIKSGDLKPGDKVPSESELKKKYRVSTITVRKAFNDLINAGYLRGIQGAGTFVAKKQIIRGLTSISFSEELLQQGYVIDMRLDSIEEIQNETVASILGIDKEHKLICVKRIRTANGDPIAYQTSYMSTDLLTLEQAQSIKKTRSFYKTLNKVGIYPVWVNENYSVKEINDPNIYGQMAVKKGYPSFFVKRIAFDRNEEIIEYAETYFNKESYSVTVNIRM